MKHSLAAAAIIALCAQAALAETLPAPELFETGVESELYQSDAVFFPAEGSRAVVFVPGYIFNKESWTKLAKTFQARGIASIAISGKIEKNVRQAIRELGKKGYQDIVLVGGSSGAAAVLNTMEQVFSTDNVTAVVMLSPVRGNPMDDQPVRKLFIVSEGEKSFAKVQGLFAGSIEPKTLMTVPGKAHAQFLFYGPDSGKVTEAIVDFIDQ